MGAEWSDGWCSHCQCGVCHVENLLKKGTVKPTAQTITTVTIFSTYLLDGQLIS